MKPTFIGCTARSGSTLLRWLIDAHPEVSCPPETDVGPVLSVAESASKALRGSQANLVWLRRAFEEVVEGRLEEDGKRLWCDKSLTNALNLDLLAKTWPSARFIFLHRHVMDFIASALSAQPWGLTDHGFPNYAAQSPGDDIGALARYWVERTTKLLEFEHRTGHPTVRLRYEDLTEDPAAELGPVWKLMGVDAPPGGDFEAPSDSHGCGDHLIWYTGRVHTPSGGGQRIPFARIPGNLRAQINGCLAELDYPQIDESWGSGGRRSTWNIPLVVVESSAAESLVDGTLNVGAALRSRAVRYYGPPVQTYGEERDLFEGLPKLLAAME